LSPRAAADAAAAAALVCVCCKGVVANWRGRSLSRSLSSVFSQFYYAAAHFFASYSRADEFSPAKKKKNTHHLQLRLRFLSMQKASN